MKAKMYPIEVSNKKNPRAKKEISKSDCNAKEFNCDFFSLPFICFNRVLKYEYSINILNLLIYLSYLC